MSLTACDLMLTSSTLDSPSAPWACLVFSNPVSFVVVAVPPTIEVTGNQNLDDSMPLALPEPFLLGRLLFSGEEGSLLFLDDLDKPVESKTLMAYLVMMIREAGRLAMISPAVSSTVVHIAALYSPWVLVDFAQFPKKPIIYVNRVILIAVKLNSALAIKFRFRAKGLSHRTPQANIRVTANFLLKVMFSLQTCVPGRMSIQTSMAILTAACA